MPLKSSVLCRKLECVIDLDQWTPLSDSWLLSQSIKEVDGILILTSANPATYKGAIGRAHVTFPEDIKINRVVMQDIGKIKKGYCFEKINWGNNGEPIRLFYENLLPQSALVKPVVSYEVLILLRVLNHCL